MCGNIRSKIRNNNINGMLLIHFMDTIEEREISIEKAYEFGQTHTLGFIY